ncbi:hypothetical protein SAMN02746062_02228 [Alysiella filiformis DSM 16848]|uniref:Uncharacterized protein n=1 Tax=Alysiella filiformis DSM 16848 TaxID=1120981 RepID=A0A286EH03_9NEIS|nr:hypothetical protein SAMN02746062_01964 [Alysiella filiformis DSM 16848]SOD72761.1 hypothetical protein SAMN02746062_02228 [Alysiella filiformis DSM 16848]
MVAKRKGGKLGSQ